MTEAGGVGKTKMTSEDVHDCHVHVCILQYRNVCTCLYLYRQESLNIGVFDVMWQETPCVEIRLGRKY